MKSRLLCMCTCLALAVSGLTAARAERPDFQTITQLRETCPDSWCETLHACGQNLHANAQQNECCHPADNPRAGSGNGIIGDPRSASVPLGQVGVELIVAKTVAAIRSARGVPR